MPRSTRSRRSVPVRDVAPRGERATALGDGFVRALDPAPVAAQGYPEHVRAHFATEPLGFQLLGQFQKNSVRDVCQRGACTPARRQLGNEHHGLASHLIDECQRVHG